jgi:hypothetical protein
MGTAFCVVFKKDVPPHGKLGGDCMALAKGYEKLDSVAQAKGLLSLGAFLSQDPDELAEIMEMDAKEMGLPPVEWFSASDGLAAVQALIAHLRANPKTIAKAKEMMSELEQMETELRAATRSKVRFHFSLVP